MKKALLGGESSLHLTELWNQFDLARKGSDNDSDEALQRKDSNGIVHSTSR